MIYYRGFSTIDKTRKWKLNDIELVKRDILNHFYTRKGERVMNPNFGSVIWNILFDGLTVDTKEVIITDSTKIVNADPRVKLKGITVDEYEHGIQLLIDLTFLPQNLSQVMYLNYNRELNAMDSY